ncbi:hypothetical protein HY994_05525 [Candidatus Micrarchaeota archaeon]|nr:hypothetical protein [Candidatus Micrarchaeota archaeon]
MNGHNNARAFPIFFAIMAALLGAGAVAAAFNVTQIQVNKDTGYGFSDVIQTPDRVYPGDQVSLRFSVFSTRTGGAQNVVITPNTPFLKTTTVFSLGNIASNVPKDELLTFTVPNSTKPGTYPLFFLASDSNTPQQQIAQYIIIVNEPSVSNQLIAQADLPQALQAGDSGVLNIAITNTAPLDAADVIVQINPDTNKVFTPLSTDRKYVQRIGSGQTVSVPFEVGISAGATPGYYQLPITIQYAVDQVVQPDITQNLGIEVQAKPELLLTVDNAGSSTNNALIVTVANVGDTPVRGVYIKTSSNAFRITGASDKFIGTLNLDDSTTMAINLQPRGPGSNGTDSNLDVSITYKDPNNQEHILKQSIPISPSDFAAGTAGNANTAIGVRFRGASRGPLGIDPFGWGAIIVVLAAGGFFGFRWYKKRKNAKNESGKTAANGGKK